MRFGVTIESIGTSLTTCTSIARQTLAMDFIARLGDLTASGKVVGIKRQRAGTDHAIMWCSIRSIAIVSCHTLLAMIALRRVLAVGTDAGATIAGLGMSVTLTGHTITAIGSIIHTMIALSTILA